MRIAIGNDHRGYQAKIRVIETLQRLGHEVEDDGSHDQRAVDYPDVAITVARKVADGRVDRGILICGTGIGMAIAANKIAGVRAAACWDDQTAAICRRHNDVNVLCLSADMLEKEEVDGMLEIWLTTQFEGGRHARRVAKISQLETRGENAPENAK